MCKNYYSYYSSSLVQSPVGQVFTQTFVDRCTNEVKVVTADFSTGSIW